MTEAKLSGKGEDEVASKIDSAFFFQERALDLRAHRQQVLAGNIANADTPHYKARDFDFASALQDALAGRGESDLSLALTHARHIPGTLGEDAPRLLYRTPMQDSADGNTVEMDVERTQFSDNALHYQAGVTFVTHQVRMLLSSIQAQ
jgi:flagellar basal-body rod protein FlgB